MNIKKAGYFFVICSAAIVCLDSSSHTLHVQAQIPRQCLNIKCESIDEDSKLRDRASIGTDAGTASVSRGEKLLLAGDSLAVGMSGEFVRIAKQQGYVPVTHALVGTNTTQWIKWIKKDIEVHSPRMIILSLGTNDAMIIDRIKKFDNIYQNIQDTVENSGAILVWIGPPKLPKDRVPHAGEIRSFLLPTIHNYFDSESLNIPRGADKIHSTPLGYNAWMKEVWSWMVQKSLVDIERNIE